MSPFYNIHFDSPFGLAIYHLFQLFLAGNKSSGRIFLDDTKAVMPAYSVNTSVGFDGSIVYSLYIVDRKTEPCGISAYILCILEMSSFILT